MTAHKLMNNCQRSISVLLSTSASRTENLNGFLFYYDYRSGTPKFEDSLGGGQNPLLFTIFPRQGFTMIPQR